MSIEQKRGKPQINIFLGVICIVLFAILAIATILVASDVVSVDGFAPFLAIATMIAGGLSIGILTCTEPNRVQTRRFLAPDARMSQTGAISPDVMFKLGTVGAALVAVSHGDYATAIGLVFAMLTGSSTPRVS